MSEKNARSGITIQREPWVALDEIAKHLCVSQDTTHRWIRSREMPAHKVGRVWRFKVSEVDEWVRAGEDEGATSE